jgi:Fe2+ transport system protein FeoA
MDTDSKTIRLTDAPPGARVRIIGVGNHPSVSRLLAMGLRPGIELLIVRRAAFGHTLYLESTLQQYGIRRDEAAHLFIEVL